MNIRASPRKGLNKNVEEVNALKAKKSLFVSKPKVTAAPSNSKETNADPKVLAVERKEVYAPTDDFVEKGITLAPSLHLPSPSLSVCNEEESSGPPSMNINVDGVNTEVTTSYSHIVILENINAVVGTLHVTPLCLPFDIGCHSPTLKKPTKLKKKINGDSIKLNGNSRRENIPENQNDQSEWAGKRKSGDMDIIMEDSETSMKNHACRQM